MFPVIVALSSVGVCAATGTVKQYSYYYYDNLKALVLALPLQTAFINTLFLLLLARAF
jgi:hypothetical protein